jgi:endonuclease G
MNINLNTPASDDTITINIIVGKSTGNIQIESLENGPRLLNLEELETKADDEANADYSSCKGFDPKFMGFDTPLPTLGKQLKRKVASLLSNRDSYVLKYHHFSSIQHALRKMPLVSVINIDGNPAKRDDDGERKDRWMRDNRIDMDVQLTDSWYSKSGFDKGHMCRREDADWGRTDAEAFRNAQLTCMYTNACPQVPDLNRAIMGKHGLWGQLEKIVLEDGVEQENGKATKICVYNGPIFISTDPVYKSIQVPMRFFKIIVWLNKAGEKKTTAFILTQEDLVGDIYFEELQFDEEFKEHQCSIEYLENITDITFTGIREWDTYRKAAAGDKGVRRLKKESLEELITPNAKKK